VSAREDTDLSRGFLWEQNNVCKKDKKMKHFDFKDLLGEKLWILSGIDNKEYDKLKKIYQHLRNDFYSLYGYHLNSEIVEAVIVETRCNCYSEGEELNPMVLKHIPDLKKNTKKYLQQNLFNGHSIFENTLTCFLCTGLIAVPKENFVESDDEGEYFLVSYVNPMDTAQVFVSSHDGENDQLSKFRCSVSEWLLIPQGDYDGLDVEGWNLTYIEPNQNKSIVKLWQQYNIKMKKSQYYKDPLYLYERVFWLNQLASTHYYPKKKGYNFTMAIKKYSYDLKGYKKERGFFQEFPVLANYWLLAHFLFSSTNFCRETIALAKKCPGKVTPILAELVEDALDRGVGLGILRPDLLSIIQKAIAIKAEEIKKQRR